MNELKLINELYDQKARRIELDYTLPPFSLIANSTCCSQEDTRKEIDKRQNALKERAEKLQQNELERTQAINNYKKNQAEIIQKMTDRELLEAIYKELKR